MSKSNEPKPAIEVKGITKTFKIPLDKGKSVKSKILGRAGKGYREFTPLNDISFTVYEGDFFGIVGRNGSGKSTLLKTIAGIYEPTAGRVKVNGTLVPFIELGVGFNKNLSGRENVYLNAAMLGFSRSEIDDMYDDIVNFAELHDFMEERLQNYSSGMQVRLAFSIAIQAKGDVLLLDEVLAVGDKAFQQKCFDYFEQLKREKKTVILVTHSMANVERFCNRALLLNDGNIDTIGSSNEVAAAYTEMFGSNSQPKSTGKQQRAYRDVSVDSVSILQEDQPTSQITFGKPFKLSLKLTALKDLVNTNISLYIRNSQDLLVMGGSTVDMIGELIYLEKDKSLNLEYDFAHNYLTDGSYRVELKIWSGSDEGSKDMVYDTGELVLFEISGVKKFKHCLYHVPFEVRVSN